MEREKETINQIKIDEGYREKIYLCSAGKLTWLYGRNLTDRPITIEEWGLLGKMIKYSGHSITNCYIMNDWASRLFDREIECLKVVLSNELYPSYENFPEEVRIIILNMSYNMGVINKTAKFNPKLWPNFFKAIFEHNWKKAAIEGRDSLWFNQVGNRSIRLMKSLESISES